MKEFNEVLSKAFDGHRRSKNRDLPDWLKRSEIKTVKSLKFDFGFDLNASDLDEFLSSNKGETFKNQISSSETISEKGHEVLGFYVPYSFSEPLDFYGWGVHFRLDAIAQYSAELLSEFRSANSQITYGKVFYFVLECIRRHELEHACSEIVSGFDQIQNYRTIPAYIEKFSDPSTKRFSEIVAMQQEILSSHASSRLDKHTIRRMIPYWVIQPLPSGYNEWMDFSTIDAEKALFSLIAPSFLNMEVDQIRKQIGSRGISKAVKIPTYYWWDEKGHGSFSSSQFRAVFDCKKMSRFLRKSDGKSPFGTRVQIEKSSDHDF